ncbi:ATPase domain protein, prokaryote domain protein [Candidatus Magnetomorum sp. HK-1]|nr:ATPase domain protein, prokaryote domain protein [Candidatus Magnetomorum sp. HK-1]
MPPNKQWTIKPLVPDEIYTDRKEFLDYYFNAAIGAKKRKTMSSVLLGMRRMGKTEIFKRVINRLFIEQDHSDPNAAIPVFYQFPDEVRSLNHFAFEYVENFIRWYAAFKTGNNEILSKPKKTKDLFAFIKKRVPLSKGFSVAIDLLEGIIEESIVLPEKEVLHLPRTVADIDDSTIIMFIDEFQNSRQPQHDFSVTGFFQEAVESPNCPHFVTGSAMSILSMELIGAGALFGRFHFKKIEGMSHYHGADLALKAAHYYQADITESIAAIISERCGGNPFYITAVIRQAIELDKSINDESTLNDILAVDISSGFIWGELCDQVNRWISRINQYKITKWVLYLSALEENDHHNKNEIDLKKIQKELKVREGFDVDISHIRDIMTKLSRGDLLECRAGAFSRVNDPILCDFLKVWGKIEIDKLLPGDVKYELKKKYYHVNKRKIVEYKGYLGEIHMSQILLATSKKIIPGKYFNQNEDIHVPDFSYVHHRVRLSSGENMEIDILAAGFPETWVCQSKWLDTRKIGVTVLKHLLVQADAVKKDLEPLHIKKWIFAYSGLTADAKKYAKENNIFWSAGNEMDALLKYLKLRPLYAFKKGIQKINE